MSSSSSSGESPKVVEDITGFLQILSDGTVLRSPDPLPIPVRDDGSVEWREVQFDSSHSLILRLYKPRRRLPSDPTKFPIFFYFHGGGFCVGSCAWPNFQNYCLRLSSELRAVVVAPDYRLAPEHRLPAAIDDAAAAVKWLRSQDNDPWLAADADFDRVFISGDSSGGTIAHHLAVRAELGPVRVRGFVQLMPFFGGTQRTKSEAECPKEAALNLELSDRLWRLSTPVGADLDHPLVNPFGPESLDLEPVRVEPMLVVVGEKDLLRDRAVEYARRLKGWGKPVEVAEFGGQQHGFFTMDPWSQPADELMRTIKTFMDRNGLAHAKPSR